MKTKQGVQHFLDYHRTNSKKNTYRNYSYVLGYFQIEVKKSFAWEASRVKFETEVFSEVL